MELARLTLEIAQRVVIHDGIAGDIVERLIPVHAVGALADDDRQLAFIIQLLCGKFWNEDIIIGAGEGIGELDEQGGVFGEFPAHFADVFGVIKPDADNLAGIRDYGLQVGVVEDHGFAGKLRGLMPIFAAQQLAHIFIIQFDTHIVPINADSGGAKASA